MYRKEGRREGRREGRKEERNEGRKERTKEGRKERRNEGRDDHLTLNARTLWLQRSARSTLLRCRPLDKAGISPGLVSSSSPSDAAVFSLHCSQDQALSLCGSNKHGAQCSSRIRIINHRPRLLHLQCYISSRVR